MSYNPYMTTIDDYSFALDIWDDYGSQIWPEGWLQMPGYQYQGMGSEIMDALGQVFYLGEGDRFDISELYQTSGPQPFVGDITDMTLVGGEGGQLELDYDIEHTDFQWGELEGLSSLEGDYDYSELGILPFIDVFDPESLAIGLSGLLGVDDSIRTGEVRALTPDMIEKTTSAYYDPYEYAERESLIEKKAKKAGKETTGGFAGSAGREAGLSALDRLYRGGYADLIAAIQKMQGEATGSVLDTIYGWQELMTDYEATQD